MRYSASSVTRPNNAAQPGPMHTYLSPGYKADQTGVQSSMLTLLSPCPSPAYTILYAVLPPLKFEEDGYPEGVIGEITPATQHCCADCPFFARERSATSGAVQHATSDTIR